MDVFGIGGESGIVTLFVVLTLEATVPVGFSLWTTLRRKTSTTAAPVEKSMRQLTPDENHYFIKPSMKPHYHGQTKIGYVEPMEFGCHIFDSAGQIKGIVGNEQRGREFLRGVHKVTVKVAARNGNT